NGRPAPLSQLATLAGLLVEIHGQHEHQALLSRASQLALLDAFGGHGARLEAVAAAAAHWNALLRERDALARAREGRPGDVAERGEWLEHQLAELDREPIDPAAIADLDAAHRRQAHSSALIAACDAALAQLDGDVHAAVPRQLRQLQGTLAGVQEHEPRLAEVDAMLDAAAIQ